MELKKIRAIVLLIFIGAVFYLLIDSRIQAYSLAPTLTQADMSGLAWYEIPAYYIWDYASHGWICLLFAFVLAGLFYEFVPKEFLTKRMNSKKASGYLIGIVMAPFFTVCSCTMVPIFGSIMYAGAGIGPAITFLLMAPSANVLSVVVTGGMIGWDIAIIRILVSVVTALVAGVFISRTSWGRAIEEKFAVKSPRNKGKVKLTKSPFDERMWSSMKFSGFLAKKILPYFILGLVAVSYVQAYLPEDAVAAYLTGITGVILASVIGGPLYTPTLVEIALGKALLTLGMSKAALLSWLMGQPYDIPNMVAVSRLVKWKVVINYAVIALLFSIFFGIVYGLFLGTF